MQRVERAVADLGGRMHAILRAQGDGGGSARGRCAAGAGGHFVALHVEEVHAGVQRLADQQFESALGGFEFVAFVLHLLDAFEQIRGARLRPGDRPGRAA